MKIAIIGAGASGLFCAGKIDQKHVVDVYEKNGIAGKKVLITGNGRCNVTNLKSPNDFLQNVFSGNKFLYSAINSHSPQDTYDLLTENGIELIEETENKIFPKLGKSKVIVEFLLSQIKENVSILYGCEVNEIEKNENNFVVHSKLGQKTYDIVLVATGGKSYPLTGSDGKGYEIAQLFGHSIVPLRQSLCGLIVKENILSSIRGVSFDAKVSIKNENGIVMCAETGSVMITHFGVSGPAIHRLTAKFSDNDISNLVLEFNFFPNLSVEQFKTELLSFIKENSNLPVSKFFEPHLTKRMFHVMLQEHENVLNKNCGNISKQDEQKILSIFTEFKIDIESFDSFERAIVTRGGVNTNEVNPKTMESKLVKGLYFSGELLNVDGLTGGYNLQIAFATGNCVANAINGK